MPGSLENLDVIYIPAIQITWGWHTVEIPSTLEKSEGGVDK